MITENSLSPEIAQRLSEASALRESGQVSEAISAYRSVLSEAPNLPDSWYNLGWLLRRAGDPQQAIEAYDRALALGIKDPEEVHLNRGVIFADDLNSPDRAVEAYRTALALNADFLQARFNLANSLEDVGDRDGAAAEYRALLEYNPRETEPLARLANLTTVSSANDGLVIRLESERSRPEISKASKASLEFALGRLLDQVGEYDRAFEAFKTANFASSAARQSNSPKYDPAKHDAQVSKLLEVGIPSNPAVFKPTPIQPVFIVGQFRSGSTLLEQILSSHSAVATGGELGLLPSLAGRHLSPYPQSLSTLSYEMATKLREAYLDGLKQRVPNAAGIVTDKRPDNFYHVGLILRLFPDAKILHTVRDPRDTCLSNYFLHLSHQQPHALTLSHLGHQYRAYQRVMAHWKDIAPEKILDVDYDVLVQNPEAEIRKTLDFLNMPFEPACLDFQNSDAPVKTASVWQVREPLYQRSSGRWRNYESHLGPLLEALND
jgi:tetratricopeptide (TPR) repeat protein